MNKTEMTFEEALREAIRDSIEQSCSLTHGPNRDTRDCVVTLDDEGTLDVRMVQQGETFREAVVVHTSRHWVAWDAMGDVRQCIADSDTVQEMVITEAMAHAVYMGVDGEVSFEDSWEDAYGFLDVVSPEIQELLAQEYLEWYLTDCDDYLDMATEEALRRVEAWEVGE